MFALNSLFELFDMNYTDDGMNNFVENKQMRELL